MKASYELVRVIPIEGGYVVRMRAVALDDTGRPITKRVRTGTDPKTKKGIYEEIPVDAEHEAVHNGSWKGDPVKAAAEWTRREKWDALLRAKLVKRVRFAKAGTRPGSGESVIPAGAPVKLDW